MDTDAVLTLLQETAEQVINPRFRALADGEVMSKSRPDDLVTVADQEAEVIITAALRAAYPHAVILGEEASLGDATMIAEFRAADHAFTVDPVDGTRNFVNGSPDHAVMVSEVRDGQAVRAWIWQPQHGVAYVAERGAGLWRNGERVQRDEPAQDPSQWRARTSDRRRIGTMVGPVGPLELTWISCGIDYPKLAGGACDVIVYAGTLPWDHVPGSLMIEEIGGALGDLDGRPYTPSRQPRGIVAAATPGLLESVLAWL